MLSDGELAGLRMANNENPPGFKIVPWETVESLLDEVERSRALLKRLEWRGGSGDCPDCCGWNDAEGKHHKPDCELAALLQEDVG